MILIWTCDRSLRFVRRQVDVLDSVRAFKIWQSRMLAERPVALNRLP